MKDGQIRIGGGGGGGGKSATRGVLALLGGWGLKTIDKLLQSRGRRRQWCGGGGGSGSSGQ